eukprot:gene38088-47003_t
MTASTYITRNADITLYPGAFRMSASENLREKLTTSDDEHSTPFQPVNPQLRYRGHYFDYPGCVFGTAIDSSSDVSMYFFDIPEGVRGGDRLRLVLNKWEGAVTCPAVSVPGERVVVILEQSVEQVPSPTPTRLLTAPQIPALLASDTSYVERRDADVQEVSLLSGGRHGASFLSFVIWLVI